jgi:ABC-type proline/glycine betaine transport system substrate-binding protein
LIIIIQQPVTSQTKTINLARSNRQTGFTTEIVKQLLEALDYQVAITQPMSDQEFYLKCKKKTPAKNEGDLSLT